jgi:hypothetical protein
MSAHIDSDDRLGLLQKNNTADQQATHSKNRLMD